VKGVRSERVRVKESESESGENRRKTRKEYTKSLKVDIEQLSRMPSLK
jgi:hypothetical protein